MQTTSSAVSITVTAAAAAPPTGMSLWLKAIPASPVAACHSGTTNPATAQRDPANGRPDPGDERHQRPAGHPLQRQPAATWATSSAPSRPAPSTATWSPRRPPRRDQSRAASTTVSSPARRTTIPTMKAASTWAAAITARPSARRSSPIRLDGQPATAGVLRHRRLLQRQLYDRRPDFCFTGDIGGVLIYNPRSPAANHPGDQLPELRDGELRSRRRPAPSPARRAAPTSPRRPTSPSTPPRRRMGPRPSPRCSSTRAATLLGTVTTSPYNFTWNSVAAGAYALTVIATDSNQ